MIEDRIKQRVQSWILVLGMILLLGKFGAFYLTNSVGILTDAMESIVNVLAGVISLYSLKMAAKPKDEGHPFGHGKSELISASIEGILIILAGGVIVWEGISRLASLSMPNKLDVGIYVIAFAGVVNYLMGWYSIKIGKRHNSMALIAGGKHLQSDTYSTIGLIVGLVLLYVTEIPWIDSALALIFGSIIVWTGISILRKTVANLMDKADTELLGVILKTVNDHRQAQWIDIHNTKMIRYGSYFYIDCDLTMPWYYNIRQGHDTCDALKEIILHHYSDRVMVSVHSDSCDARHCAGCAVDHCAERIHGQLYTNSITMIELTESDEERAVRLNMINSK